MTKLPEPYLEQMKELLKDGFEDYLKSFEEKRVYSLRINTSKISVRDFLKINPFHLTPIPWTDDGFYYEEEDKPSKYPYYYAGLYYLQEASAMYPAQALPIEEGDIVLDCCAAPGGKSTKLANKLKGSGVLISNDISVSRAQSLLKNLEIQGVTNACVMAEDISKIDRFNETFDKILIDAPCSGQGMFRKENDLIKAYEERGSQYYVPIQKQIISSALKMLKQGGMILYSTCTFSPQEDEDIIEYALDICPELKVLPLKKYDGFESGITKNTENCVRLYPHLIKGEGHFIALLQKGERKETQNIENSETKLPDDPFFNNVDIDLKNRNLVRRKEKLYLEPSYIPDTQGLRVLRSGLYLGEYRHDRFEASQALASSLKYEEYKNTINFDVDDSRVIKYLKCETLDVKDKHVQGIVLVCVDHFPLGFGNISKGILKNKYPANFRYQ